MVDLVDLGFRVDSRDLKTASGELDKLDDAGKRVEGRSTRLTTSFGGLAKAAGALGLGAIVTDSLNKFRSFESMSASLKTVTGSVEDAGDAMGVIQEFARSTPFTLDQSVQGFIKLKSLGLDPSAEALRSYGNTASAMGKDMNQMVEAVADASTSEFERLKEFGIKAKQQGEEVSFTFQGVTTTVGNNSEAIQGYLLGIGNTQFAGAMEDQMGTVNGAVSNMQDSFSGLQRTFIDQTGYAESYKQKMLSLAEVFDNASRWIVSARDSFDEFTDTLNGVGSLANAQAGPAMEGIYGIINNIRNAVEPLLPYVKDFGIALAAIGATAVTVGALAAGLSLVAGVVLSPVAIAVGAIAGGAVLLRNNWDGVSAWWAGLWDGLDGDVVAFSGRLISSLTGMAGDFIASGLSMAAGFVGSLATGLSGALGSIQWPTATEITTAARNMTVSFGIAAIAMVDSFITSLSGGISGSIGGISWPSVSELISSAASMISGFGTVALTMTRSLLAGIGEGVRLLLPSIPWPTTADIARGAVTMIQGFSAVGDLILGGLINVLNTGIRSLVSAIRWATGAEIATGASGFISGFGTVATAAINVLINGISSKITTIARDIDWPSLGQLASGAAQFISAFGSLALTAVSALASGIGAQIKNIASGIEWPTAAEIGRGAAQLLLAFGGLAVDAVGALIDGISSKMSTVGTDTKWPTAGQILAGAGNLIEGFVTTATTLVTAFVAELGIGLGRSVSEIEWPTAEEIARGAARLIVGFVGLAADAVGSLIGSFNSESNGIMSRIEWPTAAQVFNGAVDLIAGFVSLSSRVILAFASELAAGLVGIIKNIEWPTLQDLLAGAGEFLGAFGDLAVSIKDKFNEGLAGLAESVTDIFRGNKREVEEAGAAIPEAIGSGIQGNTATAVRAAENSGADTIRGAENGMLSRFLSLFGVAEEAGEVGIDGLNKGAGVQSPSWKSYESGAFIVEGAVNGVSDNASTLSAATEAVADEALRGFERIMSGLDDQITTFTGVTDGARKYGEEWERLNQTQRDAITDKEGLLRGLQEEQRLRDELSGGIRDAIVNADSVRDALGNLGGFMTGWLSDKVRKFAANQVIAFLGMDTGGAEVGLTGFLSKAGSLLTSFFSEASGGFGGLFESVKGLFSGGGGIIDTISGGFSRLFGGGGAGLTGMFGKLSSTLSSVKSVFSGAVSSIKGVGTAINAATGGFAGTAAGALGAAGAAYFLGSSLGDLLGAANSTAVGIGSGLGAAIGSIVPVIGTLAGGVIGGAIGSAFGTSYQQVSQGFDLAFKDGALVGKSVQYFEKEKSFWRGTARREVESALDASVAEGVTSFFNGISTSVISSAQSLGVVAADGILDSFDVAMTRIKGDHASEQLEVFMQQVSLGAYETLYNNLGPAVSDAITDVTIQVGDDIVALSAAFESITDFANLEELEAEADRLGLTLEQLQGVFGELEAATTTVAPLLQAAGFNLSGTADEMAASAINFAQSAGGVEPSLKLIEGLLVSVGRESDIVAASLDLAQTQVSELNAAISSTGDVMTLSSNGLAALKDTIEATGDEGGLASALLDGYVTNIDNVSGAVSVNSGALERYANTIDTSTEKGAALADSLLFLTSGIGELGDVITATDGALVNTTQGALDYLIALQDQFATGEITKAQYVSLTQALEESLPAIQAVEEAARAQTETFNTVSDAATLLNLNFSDTSPAAMEAAESLVELLGGLDAFNSATKSYYETFYSAEEQKAIALAQSASAVEQWSQGIENAGLSAITSNDQFRTYIESLDLTTAAGQQAFAAAMQVQDAFVEVTSSGQIASDILSNTPNDILLAANAFNTAANDSANSAEMMQQSVIGSNAQMTSSVSGQFVAMSSEVSGTTATLANNVKGQVNFMKDGVASSFTSLKDTVVNSANESQNSWNGAASTIKGSASAASGALQNASGAMSSFSGAVSGVGNKVIAETNKLSAWQRDFNVRTQNWFNSVNGFETGLDRVNVAAMPAIVHKDEMIARADVANQLRAMGVTATSIPESFGKTRSVTNHTSTPAPVASNDGGGSDALLQQIASELAAIRSENADSSEFSARVMKVIATETRQQTTSVNESKKELERLRRQTRVA